MFLKCISFFYYDVYEGMAQFFIKMTIKKNSNMHNFDFLTEVEVWSRDLTSLFKEVKMSTM